MITSFRNSCDEGFHLTGNITRTSADIARVYGEDMGQAVRSPVSLAANP